VVVNGLVIPPDINSTLKIYDEVGTITALLQQEAARQARRVGRCPTRYHSLLSVGRQPLLQIRKPPKLQ
jgi:hypothetical protein